MYQTEIVLFSKTFFRRAALPFKLHWQVLSLLPHLNRLFSSLHFGPTTIRDSVYTAVGSFMI